MRNGEFKTIVDGDVVYVDGVKCYCCYVYRTSRVIEETDQINIVKYAEPKLQKQFPSTNDVIATVTFDSKKNVMHISPTKYTCEDIKSDAPQFSLSYILSKKIKQQSLIIGSAYDRVKYNVLTKFTQKKKPLVLPKIINEAASGDVLYINGVECVVNTNHGIGISSKIDSSISNWFRKNNISEMDLLQASRISNKPPKEKIQFDSLVTGDVLYVNGEEASCKIVPKTETENKTIILYKLNSEDCFGSLATITITNLGNVHSISPGVFINDIMSKKPSILYYIARMLVGVFYNNKHTQYKEFGNLGPKDRSDLDLVEKLLDGCYRK